MLFADLFTTIFQFNAKKKGSMRLCRWQLTVIGFDVTSKRSH